MILTIVTERGRPADPGLSTYIARVEAAGVRVELQEDQVPFFFSRFFPDAHPPAGGLCAAGAGGADVCLELQVRYTMFFILPIICLLKFLFTAMLSLQM